MFKPRWLILTYLCLGLILAVSGCDFVEKSGTEDNQFFQKTEPSLIYAEIHLEGETVVTGYIKGLTLNTDEEVYHVGPAVKYLYDAQGNKNGFINYQRVLYVKIIPEPTDGR